MPVLSNGEGLNSIWVFLEFWRHYEIWWRQGATKKIKGYYPCIDIKPWSQNSLQLFATSCVEIEDSSVVVTEAETTLPQS